MSLIERLEKLARWHERRNECPLDRYSLAHEDARALYTAAAERIKGLQCLVDAQRKQGGRD